MAVGEPFHDVGLNGVGILVFVHHDIAVLSAQTAPDHLMFGEKLSQEEKQIVVVHQLVLPLVLSVEFPESLDLGNMFEELRILFSHEVFDGPLEVCGLAQDVGEGRSFRKSDGPLIDLNLLDDGLDHLFHVRSVQDGKGPLKAQKIRMLPQHPVGQGVECPPRYMPASLIGKTRRPFQHLPGRLSREGEKEDAFRRDSFFNEASDSVDEGPGFSAPCPGDHQQRAFEGHDRFKLGGIEDFFVVDHGIGRPFPEPFYDISRGRPEGSRHPPPKGE